MDCCPFYRDCNVLCKVLSFIVRFQCPQNQSVVTRLVNGKKESVPSIRRSSVILVAIESQIAGSGVSVDFRFSDPRRGGRYGLGFHHEQSVLCDKGGVVLELSLGNANCLYCGIAVWCQQWWWIGVGHSGHQENSCCGDEAQHGCSSACALALVVFLSLIHI